MKNEKGQETRDKGCAALLRTYIMKSSAMYLTLDQSLTNDTFTKIKFRIRAYNNRGKLFKQILLH